MNLLKDLHPPGRRPEKLAMVGLGPSANQFWLEVAIWNQTLPWTEVWAINRAATAFACDLQWNMHDLRDLTRRYPLEKLRLVESRTPIVTVAEYPEFPATVRYPIEQVLDYIQHDILNSTPAYMMAYAMMIGVKDIYLYGMDFHYPNIERAEAGGQGMAYMLGMCQASGIQFHIPNSSSLLDAFKVRLVRVAGKADTPMRPLYGYRDDQDPRVPAGAQVIDLKPQLGQMTAHDKPYALGEAEEGDRVTAPALHMADGQEIPHGEPSPRPAAYPSLRADTGHPADAPGEGDALRQDRAGGAPAGLPQGG